MKTTNPPAVSRRIFLKQTAAAATCAGGLALVPSSLLGRGAEPSPSNKITLGCIGVGGRGRGVMEGLISLPEAKVLAVCDTYEERRQAAKKFVDDQGHTRDCTMHSDWREVVARRDLDAVLIAPQDHWHALIATAAARAGKDIYCEKPLGVSVEESQAIRDAVKKHGRVFQTGTQQRSERNFRFASELARNGYLGRLHTVQVGGPGPTYQPAYKGSLDPQPVPKGFDWDMWLGPAPKKPYNPGRVAWPDWYLIWDYCAGFIVNWGVHHLDIALWGCPALAEETFEVECRGTYRKEGWTDNISGWEGQFTYPSGLKLVYTDDQHSRGGCRFIGDEGWIHVDRGFTEAKPESLLEIKLKASDVPLHKSTHHGQDFLQSVKTRQPSVSDIDAGHRASYFGMLADIAARLQRKIKWDPKVEQFIDCPEAVPLLHRPVRLPWKLSA